MSERPIRPWFYADSSLDLERGPVSAAKLKALAKQRVITGVSLVRRADWPEAKKARDVKGLIPSTQHPAQSASKKRPGAAQAPTFYTPEESGNPFSPGSRQAQPAISFACDSCGRKYKVAAAMEGRTFACKTCGTSLRVPEQTETLLSESDFAPTDSSESPDESFQHFQTPRSRKLSPMEQQYQTPRSRKLSPMEQQFQTPRSRKLSPMEQQFQAPRSRKLSPLEQQYGGGAGWQAPSAPTASAEALDQAKKSDERNSLLFGVVGIVVAMLIEKPESADAVEKGLWVLASLGLFTCYMVGMFFAVRSKGHHPAMALACFFPIIGWIVLALIKRQPYQTLPGRGLLNTGLISAMLAVILSISFAVYDSEGAAPAGYITPSEARESRGPASVMEEVIVAAKNNDAAHMKRLMVKDEAFAAVDVTRELHRISKNHRLGDRFYKVRIEQELAFINVLEGSKQTEFVCVYQDGGWRLSFKHSAVLNQR